MQIDKYRTFAKNVLFNNSEIFSYDKMHKTLLILLLIFKYFILNYSPYRISVNIVFLF